MAFYDWKSTFWKYFYQKKTNLINKFIFSFFIFKFYIKSNLNIGYSYTNKIFTMAYIKKYIIERYQDAYRRR